MRYLGLVLLHGRDESEKGTLLLVRSQSTLASGCQPQLSPTNPPSASRLPYGGYPAMIPSC
jgi:hypothetical protein